jgi:hypothetical protein
MRWFEAESVFHEVWNPIAIGICLLAAERILSYSKVRAELGIEGNGQDDCQGHHATGGRTAGIGHDRARLSVSPSAFVQFVWFFFF